MDLRTEDVTRFSSKETALSYPNVRRMYLLSLRSIPCLNISQRKAEFVFSRFVPAYYTSTCCDAFHRTSLLPSAPHPHRNRPKVAINSHDSSYRKQTTSRRLRWTCRAVAQGKTPRWRFSSPCHHPRTKHKQLHVCTAVSIDFGLLLKKS
jgi:hypothetical protein